MADVITFRGATIFSTASGGVGYAMRPASLGDGMMEIGPPQGKGYWLKEGNPEPADHDLELTFLAASVSGVRAAIDALMTGETGSLVVPDWGTFTNCRLMTPTWGVATGSDVGKIVPVTLSFRQYPDAG